VCVNAPDRNGAPPPDLQAYYTVQNVDKQADMIALSGKSRLDDMKRAAGGPAKRGRLYYGEKRIEIGLPPGLARRWIRKSLHIQVDINAGKETVDWVILEGLGCGE
jgi:hypothetical protein